MTVRQVQDRSEKPAPNRGSWGWGTVKRLASGASKVALTVLTAPSDLVFQTVQKQLHKSVSRMPFLLTGPKDVEPSGQAVESRGPTLEALDAAGDVIEELPQIEPKPTSSALSASTSHDAAASQQRGLIWRTAGKIVNGLKPILVFYALMPGVSGLSPSAAGGFNNTRLAVSTQTNLRPALRPTRYVQPLLQNSSSAAPSSPPLAGELLAQLVEPFEPPPSRSAPSSANSTWVGPFCPANTASPEIMASVYGGAAETTRPDSLILPPISVNAPNTSQAIESLLSPQPVNETVGTNSSASSVDLAQQTYEISYLPSPAIAAETTVAAAALGTATVATTKAIQSATGIGISTPECPMKTYKRSITCSNGMRCEVTYKYRKGLSEADLQAMDKQWIVLLDDQCNQGLQASEGDKFTIKVQSADSYVIEGKTKTGSPINMIRQFTPQEMTTLPAAQQFLALQEFIFMNAPVFVDKQLAKAQEKIAIFENYLTSHQGQPDTEETRVEKIALAEQMVLTIDAIKDEDRKAKLKEQSYHLLINAFGRPPQECGKILQNLYDFYTTQNPRITELERAPLPDSLEKLVALEQELDILGTTCATLKQRAANIVYSMKYPFGNQELPATIRETMLGHMLTKIYQPVLTRCDALQKTIREGTLNHLKGYETREKGKGGDCLFCSFAGVLNPAQSGDAPEAQHKKQREKIVAYMEKHEAKFQPLIETRMACMKEEHPTEWAQIQARAEASPFEKYLNWMKKTGHFGAQPELQAFCDMESQRIVCVMESADGTWSKQILYPEHEAVFGRKRPLALWTNGGHYQAMLPK